MSTSLVLLADTHWPKRAKVLPDPLWSAVEAADVVVHAGDWVEEPLVDELEARSRRLVACWGNNDGPEIRRRLPEVARTTIDGVRLAVVHETGSAQGREKRMEAQYPDVDVLVFGHSHIPWDTVTPSGLRLLNPGSPTDRRRQPFRTFMTAEVSNGHVDVTLHQL
ncbi:metallophosphoesterase [Georgenia sp. MJ206]|uniref:metallophosphoesterase family protein n=1 Tax=Georgenia wangjunii TaxID=3117730 RepID=UPI002F26CADA